MTDLVDKNQQRVEDIIIILKEGPPLGAMASARAIIDAAFAEHEEWRTHPIVVERNEEAAKVYDKYDKRLVEAAKEE